MKAPEGFRALKDAASKNELAGLFELLDMLEQKDGLLSDLMTLAKSGKNVMSATEEMRRNREAVESAANLVEQNHKLLKDASDSTKSILAEVSKSGGESAKRLERMMADNTKAMQALTKSNERQSQAVASALETMAETIAQAFRRIDEGLRDLKKTPPNVNFQQRPWAGLKFDIERDPTTMAARSLTVSREE